MPGTRLLLTFRGHGGSEPLPGGWTYDNLADDIAAVADAWGATGAAGLSLGAGALLRLLSRRPDRFDRLAFLLPAALDSFREDDATAHLLRLGAAISEGDRAAVITLLMQDVPPALRDRAGTRLLVERRARAMLGAAPPYPREPESPLPSLHCLADVSAPALVVTQAGDPLHPETVGARLATALPTSGLLGLPAGGVFWTATRTVQDSLARHFDLENP
jgi:pimeloyl-ACP methyl ester carboxylesterase